VAGSDSRARPAGFRVGDGDQPRFGVAVHLLLWRWRLRLIPKARDWWLLQTGHLGPVLHIGLPGAAENIAYRLAMLVSLTVVAAWAPRSWQRIPMPRR